jgi:hypothetical protein
MFYVPRFDSGSPSSLAKRTHPGWQTWVTQKGPSQRGGGGELVGALSAKDLPEHQTIHLELPAMHEPFVVAPKRLLVLCIFNSRLSSSLIDQVDIFTPELLLHSFIIYLDTERAHGDLRGEDCLGPVHHEERHLSRGSTGRCPIAP